MRNMDASEWLTAPTLNEVKAVTQARWTRPTCSN